MIAVTIFSALILRELLTPVKAVCVGVCLGGVVMVRLHSLSLVQKKNNYIYRPQTKLREGNVLHLPVSHSIHGGGVYTPPSRHTSWADTSLGKQDKHPH